MISSTNGSDDRNNFQGAKPSMLISVHRASNVDPLHGLNLLRLLQLANAHTVKELGAVSTNAARSQKKRKPDVPYRDFLGRITEPYIKEDEEMKPKQLAAVALLTVSTMAACADPKHPALNPHPKQPYEITLEIHDAPGPFESVTASAGYDITNAEECAWQDPISGARPVPSYGVPIPLTRVSDNVYKGALYLDLVEEGNYYAKGTCHWAFNGMGIDLRSHGVSFGVGMVIDELTKGDPVIGYAPKRFYFGADLPDLKVDALPMSDEIAAHPENYLSLTLIAKESDHE